MAVINARGECIQRGNGNPGWSFVGELHDRVPESMACGFHSDDIVDYVRQIGWGSGNNPLEHWRYHHTQPPDLRNEYIQLAPPSMISGAGEWIGTGAWSLQQPFPSGGVAGDIDPVEGWVLAKIHTTPAQTDHGIVVAHRSQTTQPLTIPGIGAINWIKCRRGRVVWVDATGIHAQDIRSSTRPAPPAAINSLQVLPIYWQGQWWCVALVEDPLRHGLAVYRWDDPRYGYGVLTGQGPADYAWNFDAATLGPIGAMGPMLRTKWSAREGEGVGLGHIWDVTADMHMIDLTNLFAMEQTPIDPPIDPPIPPPEGPLAKFPRLRPW